MLKKHIADNIHTVGNADDIALLVYANNEGNMTKGIDNATETIAGWLEGHGLKKTEVVLLDGGLKIKTITATVENTPIISAQAIKYLGT